MSDRQVAVRVPAKPSMVVAMPVPATGVEEEGLLIFVRGEPHLMTARLLLAAVAERIPEEQADMAEEQTVETEATTIHLEARRPHQEQAVAVLVRPLFLVLARMEAVADVTVQAAGAVGTAAAPAHRAAVAAVISEEFPAGPCRTGCVQETELR